MLVLYCSTTWFTFYSSVPLSIEPAVFSVKTTPQTRNPKVKEIPFPPMSLTLQVTLYFHFDAWMWFSYSLCFSLWQCVFPSLPSVFECLTDCLTCFCLTVSFSFFFSPTLTLTNCLIEQMCSWWFAQGMFVSCSMLCAWLLYKFKMTALHQSSHVWSDLLCVCHWMKIIYY